MMKLTKRSIPGLIALVCGAFYAPMAQAAYTTGDLLLAFRSTNSTANTFVVDIGQASLYRDSTGTIDVTGALGATLAAGLTSAFGSGWATDAGLTMGVIGAGFPLSGDGPQRAVYVGASGTTYAPLSGSDLNGLQANIVNTSNNPAGNGSFSTFVANGANAANVSLGGNGAVIATSLNNDYTDYAGLSAYMGYLPAGGNELGVVAGISGSKLDLYRILQNATGATESPTALTPQLQGSFSISNTGAVSFTSNVSAVPEPSRVMLLGLSLGGLFLRRRRAFK